MSIFALYWGRGTVDNGWASLPNCWGSYMLNKFLGRLLRHATSALAGALGSAGISSGASEEIAGALGAFVLSILLSAKSDK
jgi:hypothetical protein